MRSPQAGLEINYQAVSNSILGGAVKLFLISLCLCPKICKSKVNIRAEHSASLDLRMRFSINFLSLSMYTWNQKGSVVLVARSSILQILIVDKVNGRPNLLAAFAALISPLASYIPQSPVGASPIGI